MIKEKIFEQITYTLPAYWASMLINDDQSGLDDKEEKALNNWMKSNKKSLGDGYWSLDDDSQNFEKYHDARDFVLACDCCSFIWNKLVAQTTKALSDKNTDQVRAFLCSLYYKELEITTLQIDSVMSAIETEIKDIEARGLYDKRFNVSKNISVLVYKSRNFEVHVNIEGKISTYEDFKRS